MKATHITWDVDEDFCGNPLPTEVIIPNNFLKITDRDEFEETVADWLSDTYEMCHQGFVIED